MQSVVFGYVIVVGKLAMDARGVAEAGRDTRKGREGAESDSFVGVRILAVAAKFRLLGCEEMLKDLRAIRFESAGNGR